MTDMASRPLLRTVRENASVTLREIAAAVGISISTYRNWEFGKGNPTQAQREAIAERLGVTVDDIRWISTLAPDDPNAPVGVAPGTYRTDRGRSYIVTDDGKVLW